MLIIEGFFALTAINATIPIHRKATRCSAGCAAGCFATPGSGVDYEGREMKHKFTVEIESPLSHREVHNLVKFALYETHPTPTPVFSVDKAVVRLRKDGYELYHDPIAELEKERNGGNEPTAVCDHED